MTGKEASKPGGDNTGFLAVLVSLGAEWTSMWTMWQPCSTPAFLVGLSGEGDPATVATQRRELFETLCPAAPHQLIEPHVRVMNLVDVRVGEEDAHPLAQIRRHVDSCGAVPAHFAVVEPSIAVAKDANATILDSTSGIRMQVPSITMTPSLQYSLHSAKIAGTQWYSK